MDKISMITLLLARAYTDKKTSEVPAVIQYKGVTTTALSDGATTNPITINGSSYTAVNGDTVFYNGVAYTFDGTVWQETVSLAQIITALEDLEDKIGDLDDLTTETKTSVVAAINELVTALGAITDGQSIDSFSDVETALASICDDANIDSFADVVTALGNKVDKVQGKGLSTNDYTDADAAIVAGVTTALAGKQDTLTFDSVPTDGSTNPVESNGVYDALATKANASDVTDALALKQDKTDNSLQTTSKTVVGAVNELKSGLTTLDTEVNGDATTYPYADVITIEDAIPANLADCTVKIEPVQDLHGFDHPWVGGADDNIAEPVVTSSQTISNIVLDPIEVDSNIFGTTISAGTVGASDVNQWLVQFTAKETTSYRIIGAMLAGTITGVCRTLLYDLTDDTSVIYSIENNNFAVDLTADHQYVIAVFYRSGTTVTAQSLSIMVCKASTGITQFKPYSNICPITGHTEESVQRDGKNLCGELELGGFDASGLNDTSTQRVRTKYYIPVIEGQQYVLYSEPTASGATVNLSAQFYSKNDYATPRVADSGWLSNGSTITIPNGIKYIRCALRYIDNRFVTVSSFDNTQIELGSTATAYEPYAGKTYTILFKDAQGQTITVYGSDLDVMNGTLTVTHANAEYDGSVDEDWSYNTSNKNAYIQIAGMKQMQTPKCNEFHAVSNRPYDDLNDDELAIPLNPNYGDYINIITRIAHQSLEDWTSWLSSNPMQLCYELATPTTIQLTPQQIQLLQGQNTLTASTGQISVTVNGVSGSIGAVQEQVNEIASDKQDKTDNALNTTAKTVVGGINELASGLTNATTVSSGTITAQEGITITRYILQKSIKTVFLFMLVKFTPTLGTGQLLCVLPSGYRAPDRLLFVGKNGTTGKLVTCETDSYGAVRVYPTSDDSTEVSTDYFLTITYFVS